MNQPNITIIDYNVGNIMSVYNAISSLGYYHVRIARDHETILNSDALILPGVGAFSSCARNLELFNLKNVLCEAVLEISIPILGICVGMQLMANYSDEGGLNQGLGWIPGHVCLLKPERLAVPHVGWNDLYISEPSPLFNNLPENPNFYFTHSYHYQTSPQFILSTCDYGGLITSVINYQKIFGVQFHPEKSSANGLKLFRNFFNII